MASHRNENSHGSKNCSTVHLSEGRIKQTSEADKEVVPPHLVKREDAYFPKTPDIQHNTGTLLRVDFPVEPSRSSSLPVAKPRTKKHPSGLFVDDGVSHDVPADCLPTDTEQDGPPISPVPLPRAKKRLSASYSASIQDECGPSAEPNEASVKSTTASGTAEDSTSPDCAVVSEGGASIQGGGDCSSQVEREVLAAMAEEDVSHSDSPEDKDKARDDISEGWSWSWTDPCGVLDPAPGLPDTHEGLEDHMDTSSAGDDWLCIADDRDAEVDSRSEVKCEEVDFGFVSVDVAAASWQDGR